MTLVVIIKNSLVPRTLFRIIPSLSILTSNHFRYHLHIHVLVAIFISLLLISLLYHYYHFAWVRRQQRLNQRIRVVRNSGALKRHQLKKHPRTVLQPNRYDPPVQLNLHIPHRVVTTVRQHNHLIHVPLARVHRVHQNVVKQKVHILAHILTLVRIKVIRLEQYHRPARTIATDPGNDILFGPVLETLQCIVFA